MYVKYHKKILNEFTFTNLYSVTLGHKWKELNDQRENRFSYIKDSTSSDYNNLLVVSCDMIHKVNEMIEFTLSIYKWQ